MMKPKGIESLWEKSRRGSRQPGLKFALVAALLGLFMLTGLNVSAQAKKVTGKVISATDKAPIPGVSVAVKGTTIGTVTNVDGQFTLSVAEGQTVTFSFVGYEPQSVKYTGQPLDITLTENSQAINEVVVVGYGVQKKKLVTGATVQVKGDELKASNSMLVGSALQGKTPGVSISQSSGQPGSTPKIVIRGVGTNQGTDPLYVVDGVPTGDINYLNPNDIESIDVLKDAASTAIYGARANNGIILITTKKGTPNSKLSVSYNGSYGVQNLAHKIQMANAYEYATLMNEMNVNSGKDPLYSAAQLAIYKEGTSAIGKGTDWQDEIFRKNTPIQDHSISLAGGNDNSVFSSSLSYSDQKGLVGNNSDYQRITFRINSEHKMISDILKFGQNLTYSNTAIVGVNTGSLYNNTMRGMFLATPLFPAYDASTDDGFGKQSDATIPESNPVASLYYKNQNKNVWDRVLGNAYFDLKLLKGLTFRTTLGLDLSYGTSNKYVPEYKLALTDYNLNTRAEQGMSKSLKYTWENYFTYNLTIDKHAFNFVAGQSIENSDGFGVSGSKENLILEGLGNALINNGTNDDTKKVNGYKWQERLASFFGRVTYNYDEKYLLTANFRRDGSSNFAKQWGNFSSVSLGWNISNEEFMESTKGWLTSLKLRGGWGQNGNKNVPSSFPYAALITYSAGGYYFDNTTLTSGSYLRNVPTPGLKWETSEQIGAGFDAVLFNKFNLSFDYYKKTTKDWILTVPVPEIVGTGNPVMNGGDVKNEGIELALGYHDQFGDLKLNVSANMSYNKNTMVSMANKEGIINGQVQVGSTTLDEMYRCQVGHSVGFFYGLKSNGLFQNEKEVAAYVNSKGEALQPNAKPGDVRFVDVNGDGVINSSDKTDLGNYMPKVNAGFNVNMEYKNFDFSLGIVGAFGNKIANFTRPFDRNNYNFSSKLFDRWHGEGTSNKIPRLTDGSEGNANWKNWTYFSDLYLENGDYVRIKNVNLGYNFFTAKNKNSVISQLRVYVSAINLYTFTKYTGLDPEIASGAPDGWAGGVDVGFYPSPRTYMVGMSIKF